MRLKIRVFDQERELRELLRIYLAALGHEVITSHTMNDASFYCTQLDAQGRCPCESGCADVIIADVNMPGMTTLEFLEQQQMRDCRIPRRNKALMSVRMTKTLAKAVDKAGFHPIGKPFHLADIGRWIAECEARLSGGNKGAKRRQGDIVNVRVLFFEDEALIRGSISTYLRRKGYEVLDFPSPLFSVLASAETCTCPTDYACTDIIVTDMNMPGMTGLDFIRMSATKSCRVAARNIIVISTALSREQEAELRGYGCHFLPKPFMLIELLGVIQACERNLSPRRKLIPVEELFKAAREARQEGLTEGGEE